LCSGVAWDAFAASVLSDIEQSLSGQEWAAGDRAMESRLIALALPFQPTAELSLLAARLLWMSTGMVEEKLAE
jgi:hypothetical protein